MNMISISPTINLIEGIVSLFAGSEKEKDRKKKSILLLRNLILECKSNIAVLKQINKDEIKKDCFSAVKAIAPLLKNEAAKLVLLGTDDCLREINLIQENIEDVKRLTEEDSVDGDDTEKYEEVKSLKEALSFCVEKIEILKLYADIPANGKVYFTSLVLSRRLNNIERYSRQILISLKTYLDTIA